jgi:lipopolysaccharide export system permease protein
MKIIERYLFRQLLGPTLGTVAALCGVAMLGQGLSTFDVIVEQRQSAGVFLQLVLLALPQVAVMILPICLFVGGLLAFNRLHTEQEIVVCFAGGMTRWRVIAPAMRLAAFAAVASLAVNLFVQPLAYRTMRDKLFTVKTDLVATLIREGEFTHPANGLTVYAQSSDAAGRLRNVIINERREDGTDTTFSAAEGRIAEQDGRPALFLRYGTNNEINRQGVLNVLAFDEYVFDLSPYLNNDERIHYKISDRYLHELVFPDLRQEWERNNRSKMLTEANYRLSSPLYCFAFTLMAIAAVIGGGFSRVGYTRRILAFGGVAAVVRIVGFGVQGACNEAPWLNVLQYLIPLAAIWWPARILFRKSLAGGRGGGLRITPLGADDGGRLAPAGAA